MFRMLIQPSSGACDYLVRYCVGCIVENASYKISYLRFTISFLLISSMPVTELQLLEVWQVLLLSLKSMR